MPSLRVCQMVLFLLVLIPLPSCDGKGAGEFRKPILQRLHRLGDQFRRFQDLTLTRLESLSQALNASTSLEIRVQSLTEQHISLAHKLTQLQNTTSQELDSRKDWVRRLQRKNRQMEGRLASLERGLRETHRQGSRQPQRQNQKSVPSLNLELHSQMGRLKSLEVRREQLLVELKSVQDFLKEQDTRMSRVEGRLEELLQENGIASQESKIQENPLTSNITPQGPTQRTQISTGQSPRQGTQTQAGNTQIQPPSQVELKPQLKLQTFSDPQPFHAKTKLGKDTRLKTGLQPPPPHPTWPPPQPQEETTDLGMRGQDKPWTGLTQQIVEDNRKEGEMERRRGGEVFRGRMEEQIERRRGEEKEEKRKGEEPEIQNILQLPFRHKIPLQHVARKEAMICNVDSMLLFPSASSENYVTFTRSFPALPEVSVCLWLRVDASYVGTLLSYATEDNDNKLVLYGRGSASSSTTPTRPTLDFVVGDPAYRELPVDSVLDGRWHHLCVLWSSIEGRFWHYTDRRLTSAGSRFRKGYEVSAGGSVVLGAEQDSSGGGFDPAEGFVGRLAGFMVWDRVLSPGEVSGVATGKGVPRGVVLGLEDVEGVYGGVQQVACQCLEHCS